MKDEAVRVNVLIGKEQRRRLFHVLLDDGISFSEWIRRQIDRYLAEKEPKPKGRRLAEAAEKKAAGGEDR
ncbi:antitoxin [bacterium]|nr:antitoxin [bacterium]